MRKAIIGLVVLAGVVWQVTRLTITTVDCFTQFGPCPDDFSSRAKFLLGRPIYWPLPKSQIAQSFAGLPNVAEVTVHRRLPKTVVVGVTLRRPIAVVLGTGRRRVVVGDDGVIFDSVDKSALPALILDWDGTVGDKLSVAQLAAAKLLAAVAGTVAQPATGRLDGTRLTVVLSNGTEIILDVAAAEFDWDASLQAIWARSKIDGKFMRTIDLRFNPPVVRN